jgi:DNA-binding MarR family transcriptional regulator
MINERIKRLSEWHAYASLQMHEAVARKAGFSGTDHKYLGFLLQKKEMTAGELSALTGLTTGAVTGLIDRLEKKKLVKRKFSDQDRRKVILESNHKTITDLLEPLYSDFRYQSEQLSASLSEQERDIIERYFEKSIEIMKEVTHKLINQK